MCGKSNEDEICLLGNVTLFFLLINTRADGIDNGDNECNVDIGKGPSDCMNDWLCNSIS